MGRPLPKTILSNLPIIANLGNGNVAAWLIRQRTTDTFIATDGANQLKVTLQAETPSSVGQAQCLITTPLGDQAVSKISRHRVRTFNGHTFNWVIENPSSYQASFLPADFSYVSINEKLLTINGRHLIIN